MKDEENLEPRHPERSTHPAHLSRSPPLSDAEGLAADPLHPSVRSFILHPSSLILPTALGAATVLGFSPFDLFPLPFVTLAGLFWLCRRAATPWRAACYGFFFGLGLFCTGLAWLYISLHDFGGMPAPIAVLAVVLLCAYMALYPAAAGWLAARLGATPLRFAVAAAAGWTVMEWLRSWVFTGFPWLNIGYSQVPWSPLAGLAPVGGVYAMSFASALMAALVAMLRAWKKSQPAISYVVAPILAIIVLTSWGMQRMVWTAPAHEPVTISLLQGNIAQELKFVPGRISQQLETYHSLAMASSSRLIVMPETSFPMLADDVPPELLAGLREHVAAKQGDVLYGVAEGIQRGDAVEYYNSMMNAGVSPAQTYRKNHLVPFGEFVPPLFGWILNVLAIPMSDFSRGARVQEPLKVAGEKVAMSICYEDVFGEEVIHQLPEATLLVNVSNDAWFGESVAPWQHTQIAQTRALETGRYMLRATNTGVTSIINHRGQLVASLPQQKTGALHGTAQGRSGATPYVMAGNGPVVALCLFILVGLWLPRIRRP